MKTKPSDLSIKLFWISLLGEAVLTSDKVIHLDEVWSIFRPQDGFDYDAVMEELYKNPRFKRYDDQCFFDLRENNNNHRPGDDYEDIGVIFEIKGQSIFFESSPIYKKFSAPRTDVAISLYMQRQYKALATIFDIDSKILHQDMIEKAISFWRQGINACTKEESVIIGRRALFFFKDCENTHAPWGWNYIHLSYLMRVMIYHPDSLLDLFSQDESGFLDTLEKRSKLKHSTLQDFNELSQPKLDFLFIEAYNAKGMFDGRYRLGVLNKTAHEHIFFIKTAHEGLDKARDVLDALRIQYE